ncbi:MAG: hypothetical protein JST91_22190 [Actinobacteria bacterium]|nr:hypothetical protein [Actinomycetota bacterium]
MAAPHTDPPIPRWLRFVMVSDRAGSAWYVGAGFFFAPILAMLSPWPVLTAVLWVVIGVAGLWLGLLGIAMAAGLALVLRSDREIPDAYWRTIVNYPAPPAVTKRNAQQDISPELRPSSRPASV